MYVHRDVYSTIGKHHQERNAPGRPEKRGDGVQGNAYTYCTYTQVNIIIHREEPRITN